MVTSPLYDVIEHTNYIFSESFKLIKSPVLSFKLIISSASVHLVITMTKTKTYKKDKDKDRDTICTPFFASSR